MLGKFRSHIGRNLVGYIALFVALGGTSYAAATIGSAQVVNDSLKSADLNNVDGVRSLDVRDDNLSSGGLLGRDIIESTLGKVPDADKVDGLDSSQLRGQQGPPGTEGKSFTWRGDWRDETQYSVRDAVAFQGSSYIAVEEAPEGPPADSKQWNLMAQKGGEGPPGSPGTGDGLFSGRVEEAPPALACGVHSPPGCDGSSTAYGGTTGRSTATTVESDATFLSPNVDLTARDLVVQFTAAPSCSIQGCPGNSPTYNQRTLTLRVNGTDTSLSCTVQGTSQTCDSGTASATVPKGSLVSVKVRSAVTSPQEQDNSSGTDVLFGWKAVEAD
jgi:hypothetical protein